MPGEIKMDAFGQCHSSMCDSMCPWDMVAIAFDDDRVCCSAECAVAVLDEMDDLPERVVLHDPQYTIDRDDAGIDEESIDFISQVESRGDAQETIDYFGGLIPESSYKAARR